MVNVMDRWNQLLNTIVFNNTIEDYAIALLTFLLLMVGLSIFRRFLLRYFGAISQKTVTDFDDFLVELMKQIGWPVFMVVSAYVAAESLVLSDFLQMIVRYAMVFVVTIRLIIVLQCIIEYSVNKTLYKRIGNENASSQAMIKSVVWLAKWALWLVGAIFILDNLGVNITSLVAGIGIGGIAIAMASQVILGDAFSALSIYLDKPFEIGDFIIIDDNMGTVEHIGLKTTRLRSLSGEQLVFSNSDLTKSRIKNYKRMQTRRIAFKLGVVYQTSVEKLEMIPDIIRTILKKSDVKIDRVHFHSFGDFALIYEIVYYVLSADYNVYMDKQQAINVSIVREFAQQGIEFAYPTQKLYVTSET